MRNIIFRVLVLSVVTFLLEIGMVAQTYATVLTLTPSSRVASIGDTINYDLVISDVTDLYGYQFSLQFDPTLVNITGLSEGPAMATAGTTFFVPGAFDNVNGLLGLTGDTLIGPISGFAGSGVLASLSFKAIGAGIGDIAVNDTFLLDSSFSEITTTVNSTSINVLANTVPEPSGILLMLVGLPLLVWFRSRSANKR